MSADPVMSLDGQALFLEFTVNHDDAKIGQMFRAAKCLIDASCNRDPKPDHLIVQCFMYGYDTDSRELWQIPECKTFFQKLIKKGWYGLVLYPMKYGVISAGETQANVIKQAFCLPTFIAKGTNAMDESVDESIKTFNAMYACEADVRHSLASSELFVLSGGLLHVPLQSFARCVRM
jgi:hypothetical protein